MTEKSPENSGALFLNTGRRGVNAPDYVGTITVDGKRLEVAAWVRDGREGEFLSLHVQAPASGRAAPGKKPPYRRRATPEQVARAEAQRARMMR
ncbi:hypothetical protein AA12717_0256 [Gluconacetobacter sacchari DSM 12717]|uniref:Uncharacterized protein n=2 Tax=Gluconacetobacter sacchari TaxID=92759 RepID=A0A7W4NKD4_9PROT|nr:hypothetical protein [Gluconacetobacter sacchari]MBB2159342.1 hypothetical protein [Gluconacetobacter sacchari]GBQ19465.1 hypothetical protein AA12717_0256 [Gluconacetobacter sacchari DSM 12717]